MTNKNTLGCLPWVGEFGWELCWWNPMARYYAKQYDHTTVAAPASSRYLYEFADTFIPLQTKGITFWRGELKGDPPVISADSYLNPAKEFAKYPNEPERVSTPRKWRSLAPENPIYQADILCAFRSVKYIKNRKIPGKEYPVDKCQDLVSMLIDLGLTVACYGGTDNYCPNGAIDLRGQPLEGQCSAIVAAKCVVGPSSGPIHLASLCGCPHVTWIASIHHTLEKRYTKLWNPFETPVRFIDHSRIPQPSEVIRHIMDLVNITKRKELI